MDEIPNGSNVIFQLLGKGQRFPDQTGHSLSERTVESPRPLLLFEKQESVG